MKIKNLPIVSALFLVIAMAIQSAVSYNREKQSMENDINNRMELAQKNFMFEVYDMYEVTDEIADFFPDFFCDHGFSSCSGRGRKTKTSPTDEFCQGRMINIIRGATPDSRTRARALCGIPSYPRQLTYAPRRRILGRSL